MLGARPGEGEWSAAGDVLNTAARIQSAAPTDGILVSRTTYLAAQGLVRVQRRRAHPGEGKGRAGRGVGGGRRRWTARRARSVPRHRSSAARPSSTSSSRSATSCSEERSAGLATIVGAPGVGKSRLLLEFVRRLEERFTVHRGKCLSYGEGITYWPIVEIFKSAAGILQSDDRDASAQKLDTFLETLPTDDLDELRTIASALSNLIGIPTTPRGTYVTSEISQAELHWGIRRALQLLASERPTAVVVEDLHWAEPTLLELISYLLAEEAGVPLAVIATTRPELEDSAPGFLGREGRRRTVDLHTLGPEQAAALLGGLAGDAAFADTPFAETLITNAGGNPLFLEETVRMLREEGLLDLERWQSEEMRDVPIPTSVQGLISSRLDRLEPKEKQLAHHASVIGAVFWAGAVARLGAGDAAPEDPQPGLSELERRDFVAHLKVSTVAERRGVLVQPHPHARRRLRTGAEGTPRTAPPRLHGVGEATCRPSADEFVEIVAWHLEQACLLAREVTRSPIEPPIREAAAMLAEAGGRAERRESLREAHRYYTRALDLLDDEHDDLRAELRLRRADMAMMLGELKEATDELLEVAETAATLGRNDVESEALLLLGDIDQRQGRQTEAHDRLLEAERLARLDRRRAAPGQGGVRAQHVQGRLRRPSTSRRWRRSARRSPLAEEIDDPALVAEGHLRIAALLMSHDLAAAEPELRRCLEIAADLGSHRIEAEATSWLGIVAYYRGDPPRASASASRRGRGSSAPATRYFQVQNIISGLAIFALDGRPAPRRRRRGCARRSRSPSRSAAGSCSRPTGISSRRSIAQDRLDDAREIVAFAARSVPEEDPHSRSYLLLAEAAVATAAGESATAARRVRGGAAPARGAQLRARRRGGPAGARPVAPRVRRDHRREGRVRAGALDIRPSSAPTSGATRSTPSSRSWSRGRLPPAPQLPRRLVHHDQVIRESPLS